MSGGSGTITDVKGGIKLVLEQIEQSYVNRSPVCKTFTNLSYYLVY